MEIPFLTGNANFEEAVILNILVPCTINVILLPHRLHHLAGQPPGNFTPMKSVVRAIAIGRRGQLQPPVGRLIVYDRR